MKLIEVLSPCADDQSSSERRRGHHAYQVAVDAIAYAHNIPFRILLVDKLTDLPKVIQSQFDNGGSGLDLMREETPTQIFAADLDARKKLYDKEIFDTGVAWVLTLATSNPTVRPQVLPAGWETAMLLLLPHLERAVWLTEIGNPLPAHALARMLEHWSLYVLFWCYEQTKNGPTNKPNKFLIDEKDENVGMAGALGIDHYVVRVGQKFSLPSSASGQDSHQCAPVIGPYWEANSKPSAEVHQGFNDVLKRFASNMAVHQPWADVQDRVPDEIEMRDALQSRIDLVNPESKARSLSCRRAFVDYFLQVDASAYSNDFAKLDDLKRQDWEVIAALCSWWARWAQLITSERDKSAVAGYWISVRDSKLGIQVLSAEQSPSGSVDELSSIRLLANKPDNSYSIDELREAVAQALPGVTIDSPDVYLNRTRERQNASWTAQVIAVNNLMNSHGGKLVDAADTVGSDASSETETGFEFEEANHLLRGYGGKVCHHLVSMTRADVADLYWMDYSQSVPRLVHAGGYSRLLLHRVKRADIHRQFAKWSLEVKNPTKKDLAAAEQGPKSDSQAYRVAAICAEDPSNGQQTVAWANDSAASEQEKCVAYFDGFPDPKPADSMALPLLVHGRVVGVLTLAGLTKGQFDTRLFVPLRRVANLLALTMYQASQLWHMRKLNWLVAHESFANWRQHNEENQFNPLKKISACLTNVFLCQAVHIWLRREDSDEIYALHGYNQKEIFSPANDPLKDAPVFKYLPCAEINKNHPIERAFVAFAEDVSAKDKNGLGRYVQARLNKDSKETVTYSRQEALQGMYLGTDYLNDDNIKKSSHGKLRTRIFEDFGLTDLMGFALLQAVPGKSDFELAGGITLHDKAEISDEKRPQPWPQAWAPVVAHVQTYLPYLFSQVELLHNPLDHTRRFLLHAGRSELLAVRDNMVQLRHIANQAFDPDGAVRKRVRLIQKMGNTEIGGQAASVEKHLSTAWNAANDLIDDSFLRNLDFLVKAIERHKEASALANFEISASSEWIDLHDFLKKALANHHDALAKGGLRDPGLTGFEVETKCYLPRIWLNQIVFNLVENAGKYARDLFNVTWEPSLKRLRFINHGRYDSNLDIENRLLRYGVRGSAIYERSYGTEAETKPGLGAGLWGVKFLCELCQIEFKMTITPLDKGFVLYQDGSSRGLASYQFDMTFPLGIVKEPPGGAAR